MLRAEGVLSPTGKPEWKPETLSKLLRNEKYTGNVMLQKTYVPDMLAARQVRNDRQIDMYYIENTHEAIVEVADSLTKIC